MRRGKFAVVENLTARGLFARETPAVPRCVAHMMGGSWLLNRGFGQRGFVDFTLRAGEILGGRNLEPKARLR